MAKIYFYCTTAIYLGKQIIGELGNLVRDSEASENHH